MNSELDRDWWDFSLDQDSPGKEHEARAAEYASRLQGHDLSYQKYLHLNILLSAQVPSSGVPDERVFIIAHQLIELVFKQMIFDFGVVARTLKSLLEFKTDDELRLRLADKSFWSSALTASSRLHFSAGMMLPTVIQFLASKPDTENHNFNQEQFFLFRDNLGHASGMQSSQFRLIQRAMGKSELLSIRLFPSKGRPSDLGTQKDRCPFISVVDDSVLVSDRHVASPQPGGVLQDVARLDELGHQVLARYATLVSCPPGPPVTFIRRHEIDKLISTMRKLIAHPNGLNSYADDAHGAMSEDAIDVFAQDLEQAVQRENSRRDSYQTACAGARHLRMAEPWSDMARVFQKLMLADDMLHSATQGFLFTHLAIARDLLLVSRRTEATGNATALLRGTGGGGTAFLGFMFKQLLPLFPALVGFRNSGSCILEPPVESPGVYHRSS